MAIYKTQRFAVCWGQFELDEDLKGISGQPEFFPNTGLKDASEYLQQLYPYIQKTC